MKELLPELSLSEDNPLNNFINEMLKNGVRSEIKDSRNTDVAKKFARALGYTARYNDGGLMRPDSDPRWTDVSWSAGKLGFSGIVKNVRVMYTPHCYAQALEDLTADTEITFPNGMTIHEVVTSLRRIRKANKEAFSLMSRLGLSTVEKIDQGYLRCIDTIQLTKYLLNSLLYIVANYSYRTGIGAHHLREAVRIRVADAIREINKTDAVVIHACYDHIVYVGEQVNIPGVHHESHNTAILIGDSGIAYGDKIETDRVPRFCINRDTWNPNPTTLDDRRTEQFEKRLALHISQCKASVAAYLNLTKEDIERKYSIDNGCETL